MNFLAQHLTCQHTSVAYSRIYNLQNNRKIYIHFANEMDFKEFPRFCRYQHQTSYGRNEKWRNLVEI